VTEFGWEVRDGVGFLTLVGAERKNPLTFASYAALRDHFRALAHDEDVHAVVIAGERGNFCSGGDVRDIIGPLTEMDMPALLRFTRMTGDLVKAIRGCRQVVIAAVDGVCVGAGAMIATAADLRLGSPRAKVAFLFTRVGLAGCDMGACAMLPRIVGQGRAAELLYTGRSMAAHRLLQPAGRGRRGRGGGAGGLAGERADVRALDDQDHARAGVGHERGGGDRVRGPGPGDLHADPGLRARLPRVRGQGAARVRG
jgi:enoyl-CoA hydratase/carnithine racemase